MLSVGYAILTFTALGGHRQLGIAAILTLLFIGLKRKQISKTVLFGFALLSIIALVFMGFIRYGTLARGYSFDKLFVISLYFLQDSLSPFDSFARIIDAVPRYIDFQYADTFVNQFIFMIPRAVWSDKPIIVMNAGNYFTQNILGLKGILTISPTILGELYMAGGGVACSLGMFLVGGFLKMIDRVFIRIRKDCVLIVFYYAFLFQLCFNLYREGVAVFLSKLLISYVLSIASLLLVVMLPMYRRKANTIS